MKERFTYEVKNNFNKTKNIKSILLYGNPEKIIDPIFTIFVPTYSRTETLTETLDSVLNMEEIPVEWEVIVLDNEEYEGSENATERLIREYNSDKILYYRNTEHMLPGDNFNRGVLLARGKWVMFCHDDDILLKSALQNMYKNIEFLKNRGITNLGGISTQYHQFKVDEFYPFRYLGEKDSFNAYYDNFENDFSLWELTHRQLYFCETIGGFVPTNGTTLSKSAVITAGGFNEEFGQCADLILFYFMENFTRIFCTVHPYGFYRMSNNASSKVETRRKIVKSIIQFRRYIYSKSLFGRIWGCLFSNIQDTLTIDELNNSRESGKIYSINADDFDDFKVVNVNPNKVRLYRTFVRSYYWREVNKDIQKNQILAQRMRANGKLKC